MATASQYSGTVEDLKGKAKQTLDNVSDRAQEIAGDAKQHLADVGGNVKGAIDKSIKDQPMTTLLVAAGLGFVIGALWKS